MKFLCEMYFHLCETFAETLIEERDQVKWKKKDYCSVVVVWDITRYLLATAESTPCFSITHLLAQRSFESEV